MKWLCISFLSRRRSIAAPSMNNKSQPKCLLHIIFTKLFLPHPLFLYKLIESRKFTINSDSTVFFWKCRYFVPKEQEKFKILHLRFQPCQVSGTPSPNYNILGLTVFSPFPPILIKWVLFDFFICHSSHRSYPCTHGLVLV